MKINRLILGSGSRFRRDLLASTGLAFEVIRPTVDEATIIATGPHDLALQRAVAKGLDVARGVSDALVIGADQVLGFGDQAFDKVATREEARERLMLFQGEIHYLHTAYCLIHADSAGRPPAVVVERVIDVPMVMRELTADEIEAYLDTDEWRDTVGCYQVENRGAHLFSRIDDDSATIIGLPLVTLLEDFRRLGLNGLLSPNGPWALNL